MTTRYYKVIDKEILEMFGEYYVLRTEVQKKANTFGEKYGLGEGGFRRQGMWGINLIGFDCTWSAHGQLKDNEMWTKPKDGYIRPKVKKGSVPHEEFKTLCGELYISGSEIEKRIGFNHMDYFPKQPGYQYRSNQNLMIFMMPESCDAVKGCVEITNIEYIKEINENTVLTG